MKRLHRQVAIKLILDVGADATARERFWREARAAAAVNHPHVCQLYDVGETDGQLYIVMELLEGQSLASRLDRGPVDLPEALTIALSILDALGALHERAIVHRDLKPSNVFLTKFGVKLLDFGLARPVASDQLATAQDLTLPGRVVGTPAYMAPEQLSGQPSDARVDLFTVGLVLYEMITGNSPFAGANMIQTMHAILHDRPPVLTGSSTVDAVDRIIHRSLEKQPGARYQSAREMADDRGSPRVVSVAGARRGRRPRRAAWPSPGESTSRPRQVSSWVRACTPVAPVRARSRLTTVSSTSGPPSSTCTGRHKYVDSIYGPCMRAHISVTRWS